MNLLGFWKLEAGDNGSELLVLDRAFLSASSILCLLCHSGDCPVWLCCFALFDSKLLFLNKNFWISIKMRKKHEFHQLKCVKSMSPKQVLYKLCT